MTYVPKENDVLFVKNYQWNSIRRNRLVGKAFKILECDTGFGKESMDFRFFEKEDGWINLRKQDYSIIRVNSLTKLLFKDIT